MTSPQRRWQISLQRFISPEFLERWTLLALGVLAVAGVYLILHLTAVAPWSYSDGTAYLAVARNIAAGRGLVLQDPNGGFSFYTWHPPLYPLALSLPIALGMEALQAVRGLNAALFGLTVFLAGYSTFRFSRSFWLAGAAAGLILTSLEALKAYAGLMSEGMFLFWILLGMLMLAVGLQNAQHPKRWLIGAGLAAGLAVLTRYTGLAWLAAGSVAVFLLMRGSLREKFCCTGSFFLPGALLSAAWGIPVFIATRTLGSRSIGAGGGLMDSLRTYFQEFVQVIASWLPWSERVNQVLPAGLWLIGMVILLGGLVWLAHRRLLRKGEPTNPHGILGWLVVLTSFIIGYILLHLGSYLSIAARPDVNGRLLLPLYPAGVLLAAAVVAYFSRVFRRRWLGGVMFALLAILSVWSFQGELRDYLYEMNHYGQGYSSLRWLGKPIFAEISRLDAVQPLYANDAALVLFHTGRFPLELDLNADRTAYELALPAGTAGVLLANAGAAPGREVYENTLQAARQQYQVLYEDEQGVIFVAKQPPDG